MLLFVPRFVFLNVDMFPCSPLSFFILFSPCCICPVIHPYNFFYTQDQTNIIPALFLSLGTKYILKLHFNPKEQELAVLEEINNSILKNSGLYKLPVFKLLFVSMILWRRDTFKQ